MRKIKQRLSDEELQWAIVRFRQQMKPHGYTNLTTFQLDDSILAALLELQERRKKDVS